MAKQNWNVEDWAVYIRDGCQCVYCGLDGKAGFAIWRQLDMDHLIPKSRGGTNDRSNKVVTCVRCNLMKGSYDPRGYEPNAITVSEPLNDDDRNRLIALARKNIERNQRDWLEDFRLMLDEIVRTRT
jgi:5-methylcytosine-specific restriction endonuclease McrA